MRRVGRYRRKKQKKILIIGSLSILLFLCVGYAAFSTNLSITAKGNIKKTPITCESLKNQVVTSGDGLYKDTYEEERYIYKGANPNNYLIFNNEMWRILSIESDNSLKIIRDELLDNVEYDTSAGCSVVYLQNKKLKNKNYVNNIIFLAPSPSAGGCVYWDNPATLNSYLNDEYLNSIIEKDKIINHDWFIGIIDNVYYDLVSQINDEKLRIWNGKVGLISTSEYIRTNSNKDQCGTTKLNYDNNEICKKSNWLFTPDSAYWTLNPNKSWINMGLVSVITNNFISSNAVTSKYFDVGEPLIYSRPALYLTPNIILSGTGTEQDPFTITN